MRKRSNKTSVAYRVLIHEEGVENLFLIPAPGEKHKVNYIPKNSVVEIIQTHMVGEVEYALVEWNQMKFLATAEQVKNFFYKLQTRKR